MSAAQAKGLSLKNLAEDSRVSYTALRTFVSTGHMGEMRLSELEWYLRENGMLSDDPEDAPIEQSTVDPFYFLADDLRRMADILVAQNMSKDLKARKLASFIADLSAGRDEYLSMLTVQNGGSGG